MAEKCVKERAKDGLDGLLAVVVNFESLRFMTLIKENYFISDLITEVEKTFTKLCSAKVTIKTLKNSMNAVLPNWYPVAPLIKNGDELFAFSDAAADVLNINFSKPTNLNFSKYTPTDTKSSCGSTVPTTYDSGFGSRNEVGTVGTNMDKESGEEGTHKTNMDIQVESHTCPGLEKSCEHQNKLMEEDCENYSILSETFSLQKQYRSPVFETNQTTRDEMLGKNKDKDSGREEETRENQNDVLSAIVTKGEKLDKSKKIIAGKSDLPKSTSSPVNTIGDTSGVIDSGRLPIVQQRSEIPIAAKLPEQGPKAKKNLTKVAAKSAEPRKRSASSSSSDSDDDSSDDSSWQSDVSVGDKKEEATKPVQKAVTAVATKRKSGIVSGKKQKEPTDSSDVVEENISVDLNDSGNSSKNSNVKANEGSEEDSASSVDSEEMIENQQAESEAKESRRERDTTKKSSSKAAQRSNNNTKTEPEKRTDKISKKTTAKTKTKSGQAVDNKSGSSDTSAAKLSDVSKAIKIKIQNRSKNSNVSRKPVGDSQNSKKSENISTKVPNKNSGKSNKDSAHSENDSKNSKKSENVSTKIPNNPTKLGNGSEKDASNQPKFVSIKFTATENAQILGKAPISEKKISNTSESDDDSDSSWTGSSASISPEKTTKKTPTAGSQEKNDESDNESDLNHNKKPVKNLEKDKSDRVVKNSNDGTSTKKLLTPKAKPTEESSGSDDDSSDSNGSLKRPLTQLPKDNAKLTNGVDMKNNNDATASTKKLLTPKAKAKPAEESSGSDDDSSDSNGSLKRPLTQLPKDSAKSKNGVDMKNNNDATASTKKLLTPKAKAKPAEESSGSDDDSSDSNGSLKRPFTQLPKDSAKSKNGVDMKNNNDATASTNKLLTPKAKAKPAEESSGSDDDSSDSNGSLKRPLTQLPKDNAKSKNGVDMKNNNDAMASTKKLLTPKAKAKPAEESSGSDDDSSDSSASLNIPLTQLPKDSAKSKNEVDKSIKNNNDDTSTNKLPTPKAKPAEESSGSDDDSSHSSASLEIPLTQLPKDGTTSRNGVDISPPSNDESDVANLRAKSASKEKSPSVLPKKKNNLSLLKTKSVTKTPSKSSRRPPQPAVTPRSRKAAVDESKNKVASWLMANDASVSGGEASSSEEEKPEAPAQKSKKRTKKSRENKTSNEEKLPANGDKAGTKVQEGDDTNTGGGEDDKEDGIGERLVSPPRVTRQSQKRKLNESTRNGTGGQPVSKNTKKNNKKGKKRPNKKNQTNSGSSQEKQDTSETDKNAAEQPIPKSQDYSKRKATPLTLPKKSKGLSALLEDDTDDDFQNSQPIKKPKLTPSWLDRQKPTGFLTPATSVERKSDKSGTRSKQRVVKKTSSSQPNRTTELNVSEKEFLSSGGVNLETLLDDENIQW